MESVVASQQRGVTPTDFISDVCSLTQHHANRHADPFTSLQRSLMEQMLLADARLAYLEQQLERLLQHASSRKAHIASQTIRRFASHRSILLCKR